MTEQDYELLSAYIDGEIEEKDRVALERRLSAEPDLRRELNALRQTVSLIKQAAPLRAPRNYTLTPEMIAPSSIPPLDELPPRRVLSFPLVSVLSTAAAVVLIALGVILLSTGAADESDTITFSIEQQAPAVADAPTMTAENNGARLTDLTETNVAQATVTVPEIQMEAMPEEADDDMAQTDTFADEVAGAGVSTLPAPPPTIALTQTVVVESQQTTLGFQATATQIAQPRDVPQPTPFESPPPAAQSGIAADEEAAFEALEEPPEADAGIAGDAPPPAVAMQAEATEDAEAEAVMATEIVVETITATMTPVEITPDDIAVEVDDDDTDLVTLLGGIAVAFGVVLLVLAGFIYWRTRG